MTNQLKPEMAYACAEVLELLSYMEEKAIEKIPKNFIKLLKDNALPTYQKHIDPNLPLEKQNFSENTLGFIGMLSLKYWCETEEEKQELQNAYIENEKKYQQELKLKYNYDNLFSNNNVSILSSSSNSIKNTSNLPVDYNSFPWYKKAFIKVKNFIYKLFKKANNPT